MSSAEVTSHCSATDLVSKIRVLLSEKLLIQVESPDADLLAAGGLDSTSLVELALGLEKLFDCRIDFAELEIENLWFVAKLAETVAALKSMVVAPVNMSR